MSHERVDEKVQDGPMVVARSLPASVSGGGTRRRRSTVVAVGLCLTLSMVACGSGGDESSTSSSPTTLAIVQLTAPAGAPTSVAAADPSATLDPAGADPTIVVSITVADVTVAPAVSSPLVTSLGTPTTAPPSTVCPGITAIPAGAVTGDQLVGDVDGDGRDDTVTAYTAADASAHVLVQRGGANASDVAVSAGGATSVSLSFEDVDASIGAEVAPPKVIMAIGGGPAGSAVATFLSPSRSSGSGRCLAQWTLDNAPFTIPIDQREPFSGLLCDGAAGKRYYVLRTATPDGLGSIVVSSREIDHVATIVTLTKLGDEILPHDANSQRNFGDIQNCDHPPLFANFPLAPVPETTTTTTAATSTTIS